METSLKLVQGNAKSRRFYHKLGPPFLPSDAACASRMRFKDAQPVYIGAFHFHVAHRRLSTSPPHRGKLGVQRIETAKVILCVSTNQREVSSPANSLMKVFRRSLADGTTKEGWLAVEGPFLVEEALNAAPQRQDSQRARGQREQRRNFPPCSSVCRRKPN